MKTKSMVVYTTTLLACIIFGFNTTVYAQYQTPPVLGTLNNENGVPNFGNNNVYDKTYYLTHPIIGWDWGRQGGIIDDAMHNNLRCCNAVSRPGCGAVWLASARERNQLLFE